MGPPGTVPYIAVVGPSSATDEEAAVAEQVGEVLARQGAVMLCGGLGGVMEAAAKGAARGGGTVVGLLPGIDRTEANAYLTVAIATGLGEMRNPLIVRAADALIAIGGAYGTLSEVAFALRTDVPVIGLRTWDLEHVRAATNPAEAVDLALGEGTKERTRQLRGRASGA